MIYRSQLRYQTEWDSKVTNGKHLSRLKTTDSTALLQTLESTSKNSIN
jgi:hypothetical protein